jgi:hypothetical protein
MTENHRSSTLVDGLGVEQDLLGMTKNRHSIEAWKQAERSSSL